MPALHPTRDSLLEIARKLPPAAKILSGVCELLHDVNTDLDQVADQIRLDATLAARVVRVSNSIVYGGRGTVSSVEEAVSRVGFSEVVRLVGAASVSRLVDQELRCYHVSVEAYRESLLMHGLASEALADRVGLNRNTAYTGGLLRGFGAMVLDRYAGDRLKLHQMYDAVEFPTYSEWEQVQFGLTSVRVTTMALDEWHFPGDIVSAVEEHLAPPSAPDTDAATLANVLNVAGAIANDHGHALPGELPHWTLTPEKLAAVGLDESDYADVVERVSAVFEQQRKALK